MNKKLLLLLCIPYSLSAMNFRQRHPRKTTPVAHQDPAVDARGNTALMAASLRGNYCEVTRLLQTGAMIDMQNKTGDTALTAASLQGHAHVVDMLLRAGALIDRQNNDGKTALMLASLQGHAPVVEILLNAKAQVNMQNKTGDTALMFAAVSGNPDIVRLLLAHKAQVNVTDMHKNRTPLQWALRMCDGVVRKKHSLNRVSHVTDIVHLLLAYGASVDSQDKKGRTALFWAQRVGLTDLYNQLFATYLSRREQESSKSVTNAQAPNAMLAASATSSHPANAVSYFQTLTGKSSTPANIGTQQAPQPIPSATEQPLTAATHPTLTTTVQATSTSFHDKLVASFKSDCVFIPKSNIQHYS